MRRDALLLRLCLGAALMVSAACGSGGSSGEGAGGSWAGVYPTLSEMTAHADAVVVGQVAKIESQYTKGNIAYTDFIYEVSTWIPVSSGGPGPTSILIHQPGGPAAAENGAVEDGGDPLMRVGERSMLFLRGYAVGEYLVTGGPTGRLLIDNGQVAALPEGRARDGLPAPVESVVARVQQYASAGPAS